MQALSTGTAVLAGRKSVFDGTSVVSYSFKQCPCCHAAMPSLFGSTAVPVSGDSALPAISSTANLAAPQSENDAKNRLVLVVRLLWTQLRRRLPMEHPRELTEAEISRLPVGPFGPNAVENVRVLTTPAHMLAAGARAEMTPIPQHRKF